MTSKFAEGGLARSWRDQVDVQDLRGLSEVRAALEPVCARLAAERLTEADGVEIDDLLDQLTHLANRGDERTLIELDQRIHRHVYRCAHNPFLEATLSEYYVLTLRIWFVALERVSLEDAVQEHRALLEAIRDRDAAAAEHTMRDHVAVRTCDPSRAMREHNPSPGRAGGDT